MKKIYLISPSLQASTQTQITDNSYSLGLAYLHVLVDQAGSRTRISNDNPSKDITPCPNHDL